MLLVALAFTMSVSLGAPALAAASIGPVEDAAPVVWSSPAGVTVNPGDTVFFSASGDGTPYPSVDWEVSTDAGLTWGSLGVGSDTLSFTASADQNGYLYRAVYTNYLGSAYTDPAALTVNQPPMWLTSPAGVTVAEGSSAHFEGTLTSDLPLYPLFWGDWPQWQYSTDGGATWTDAVWGEMPGLDGSASWNDGVEHAILDVIADRSMNGTLYRCRAQSDAGDAYSDPAQLTVAWVDIISADSATFSVGSAGDFTVQTSANPGASLSVVGDLPSGVTFVDNVDGTGTLSGTPDPGTAGRWDFTIHADTGFGVTADQTFSLVVDGPAQAPSIRVQPVDRAKGASQTVTFSAAALGAPLPAAQWQVTSDGGATWFDIPDATSDTLSFEVAKAYDGFQYRAVYTNGSGTATTTPATLTVPDPPAFAGPDDLTVTEGGSGQFLASAVTTTPIGHIVDGGTWTWITWEYSSDGGETWREAHSCTFVSGFTYWYGPYRSVLAIDHVPRWADGYLVRGRCFNDGGWATSSSALLTVRHAPSITSAAETTFTVGAAGDFTVTTDASPNATLTIDGVMPGGVTFTDNGDGTASLSGTPAAGTKGSYSLTIHAGNGIGAEASQVFTLVIADAPTITKQPVDTSALPGASALFSAAATAQPEVSGTQWQVSADGGGSWEDIPGATGATLSVVATPSIEGYDYRAAFTNYVGTTYTDSANLHVYAPPMWGGPLPSDATATVGGDVVWIANGGTSELPLIPTPFFGMYSDWQVSIDGGATWANLWTLPDRAGLWGIADVADPQPYWSGIGIRAERFRNGYLYRFGLANAAGETFTPPVRLNVVWAPSITSADTTAFTVGSTGDFTIRTDGSPAPAITIQNPLPPGVTFTDNGDGTASLHGTPAAGSGRDYFINVWASNGVGSDAFQSFTLCVPEAPAITSTPEATFTVGSAGTFTVTTSGHPSWAALSLTGALPSGVAFTDNGDGTGTFSGTPATGTGGVYPLGITGSNEVTPDATQDFTLVVNEAPSVTLQPSDTSVIAPTVATFTAEATGWPAPTGQWQVSYDAGGTWTDIPGATGDIATMDTTGSMDGNQYRVVYANESGTATSTAATLTVYHAPIVLLEPIDTTVTAGNGVQFVEDYVTQTDLVTWPMFEYSVDGGATWNHPVGIAGGYSSTWHFGSPAPQWSNLAFTAGRDLNGALFRCPITNPYGTTYTRSARLTVLWAPEITSSNAATFAPGVPNAFSVTTTANPDATLTVSGTLPSGVTFTDNGDGTASLSGTPAAGTGGDYALTIHAGNGVGSDASQSFALHVVTPPVITVEPHAYARPPGFWGVFTAAASGDPVPTVQWQVSTDGGGTWSDVSGGTSATLLVPSIQSSQNGNLYRAVFTNPGGSAITTAALLTVDGTAPVTTIHRAAGFWHTSDVTFTLEATDGSGGIGVTGSAYTIPPDTGHAYTGPVTVSAEGTTSVYYHSWDALDNVESDRIDTFGIDRVAPVTTCDAPPTHAGALHVTFSVEETTSGVAQTLYSLDGGAWTAGPALDVVTNGAHTLEFKSTDVAGNDETTKSIDFSISTAFVPISGADRYGTAIAGSKAAFPQGAPAVIICTGQNWPDAISGSSLAGAHDCPLLLVRPASVPVAVSDEIRRLGAGEAFILGGPAAIGSTVEAQLTALLGQGNVHRIGGADRYETAALVASATVEALRAAERPFDGIAFVASGSNFPDALSASPIAWYRSRPILLTRQGSLPAVTSDAMTRLGVSETVVLGGSGAVGDGVYAGLSARFPGKVSRLWGSDRYATGIAIAQYGITQGLEWDGVALATGQVFPDALSGGVMQGKFRSVVLLTPPTRLDSRVKDLLVSHYGEITNLRFLGGPLALSETARAEAAQALGY